MIKDLLGKSLNFTRENPRIIYSLVLVFIIPVAIYLNTFFTVRSFEENLENVIRSKAVLAEDIVKFIAKDAIEKPDELNQLIRETKDLNEDIGNFEILAFNKDSGGFRIIASSESGNKGKELSDSKEIFYHQIAWNQPDDNVSFVTTDEEGRSWNVLETIKNAEGEKTALAYLSFPLKEFDKMNSQAEMRSYLILALTIIIVLLLVANNARLFGYALTVTKLKEIDKMKDTFVSMASHELKAPLVSMKGNIEFFREEMEPHLNEEGRHYVQNIASSAERLEMLVNDILEVSRLEGNRIPVNFSEIEAGALIEKSIDEIKPQATQKGLALNYSPGKLPKIKVDPDRTKQILINLISNSIKYTPEGKVDVLAEVKDDDLLVTVADTGVGISAEDQAKLFQKFSRIYNEETKAVSGTGLGLWISRELARKMSGDITVESIKGVGSHFTLHLPVVK